MFLFLTLSITDACYGNLPAGGETPVLRASGQLPWTNIITSAAHVNMSDWLFLLLQTFLDLKRRIGLKRSIFCAYKMD